MRSRGKCSGSGRRAGLRRGNDGTAIFLAAICAAVLAFAAVQQCASLGGLSELLVPELLDRELELLDQQCPRPGLGSSGQPGRSLGAQHRLQRGHIVGKRIVNRRPENHKARSLFEPLIVPPIQIPAISQPSALARYVAASASRCPPAGSQAALVIVTTPSADDGHRKRPRSSRSA
jgi:hypothetical protein